MNGVLVLDKPKGITSKAAVSAVNNILKVKRAGHTGTLDPFATGVLPICVNSATKIIPFMDNHFKKYEALVRLGITTDTLDPTGRIIREREIGKIDKNTLLDIFSRFRGEINQVPPMYSALKKDGVRLYEYARKGIEIERPSRSVVIKELELIAFNPPFVRIMVECSRGTYIRVLASDISDELGPGGHLAELRRIESDGFSIDDAVTMEDIRNGCIELTPLGDALPHMGRIDVPAGLADCVRRGKQVRKIDLRSVRVPRFKTGERLKVYEGSDLVAITEALADSSDFTNMDGGTIILKLLRVFN